MSSDPPSHQPFQQQTMTQQHHNSEPSAPSNLPDTQPPNPPEHHLPQTQQQQHTLPPPPPKEKKSRQRKRRSYLRATLYLIFHPLTILTLHILTLHIIILALETTHPRAWDETPTPLAYFHKALQHALTRSIMIFICAVLVTHIRLAVALRPWDFEEARVLARDRKTGEEDVVSPAEEDRDRDLHLALSPEHNDEEEKEGEGEPYISSNDGVASLTMRVDGRFCGLAYCLREAVLVWAVIVHTWIMINVEVTDRIWAAGAEK